LIAKGTAELTKATNAQKMKMYYVELETKMLSEVANINDQIAESTMTGNEKKIDAINKQVRAAVDGAIKIREAQTGGSISDEEKKSITQEVTTKFKPQVNAQVELNKAEEAGKIRVYYEDEAFKIAANMRDLKRSTDELTMTNDEIKLNAIRRQADTEIDAYIKMRAESIGIVAAEQERAAVSEKINGLHAGELTGMQKLIDKSREFSTGWTKAWKDYNDAATNASARASEMFNTFSQTFESAFDQMVRTGKVSWNSLLQDMVASMMKSDIKRLFADLTAPTAGGSSNILKSIGSLFHASGGDIPAGEVGVVGEVRPEMVTGPARVSPTNGSGGATNVTYHINAVDAKSFQQLVASDPSFIYAVSLKGQRMLPGGA
jgi:phage-related minor tail protein